MPGDDYPEEGELVVCTVKSVKNFGAFATLDEYPGREGFIHVAEIATGWVKRMSDHVREGQRIVCKVMSLDRSKGHIDLSLKKVNAHQRREKIQEWKNEQKAHKLIEIVAERLGMTPEAFLEKHGQKLLDEFGAYYLAFEEAAAEGTLPKGFKGKWVDEFVKVAQENVAVPVARVDGVIEISCPGPEGIEHVKSALLTAEAEGGKGGQVVIQYLGAPKYRIVVEDEEYRSAEELIRRAAAKAISVVEEHGGTGKFERGD